MKPPRSWAGEPLKGLPVSRSLWRKIGRVLLTFLIAGLGVLSVASINHTLAQERIVFYEHVLTEEFDGARSVSISDVDLDGDLDIVGAADVDDAIHWWEQVGEGSWVEHKVDTLFNGANVVVVQDLDGDGDQDFLGVADSADEIAWWEQRMVESTRTWVKHTIDNEIQGAYAADVKDLDKDGDSDVLIAAVGASELVWCMNTEAADTLAWFEQAVDEDFQQAATIRAADLDGDGDMDVVAGSLSGNVIWWENKGLNELNWMRRPISVSFAGAHDLEIADMDGDQDLDVIGAALIDGKVSWWENTGGGDSWIVHDVDIEAAGARAIAIADIDADEDNDIVGAIAGTDQIIWWENLEGDATSWNLNEVDNDFDFGIDVQIADIDNDGDLDIAGAALKGDMISWWEQDTVLPVSLTHFEGLVNGSEVVLTWETADEINNSGFHIEQWKENEFHSIAFVPGAGTTTETSYYTHSVAGLQPGQFRFRLKQVDFDGTISYSHEVVLTVDTGRGPGIANIYPNPFNPNTNFSLVLAEPQFVRILVFNTLGQEVARLYEGDLGSETEHRFSFEAENLPGGLYIFRAEGERFAMEDKAMLIK